MPHSMESKKKISEGHKGQKAWNKGVSASWVAGEKSPEWKGDSVGYRGLHMWINKVLGKPTFCENGCESKRYVWANVSGEYKRDILDWHQLCAKCNSNDGVKKHPRFLERSLYATH